MLTIMRQRDGAFLLRDSDGRHVGWVRDHTVHFTGFASPLDAVAAVIGGGNAMAEFLGGTAVLRDEDDAQAADRGRDAPAGDDPRRRPVRLAHDGVHEWVVLGGRRVARLITPPNTRREGDMMHGTPADRAPAAGENRGGEFAIEFVLPDGVSTDASLTLAQVLHSVVKLHRVANRPGARRGQPTASGVGAASTPPSRGADVALPPTTCRRRRVRRHSISDPEPYLRPDMEDPMSVRSPLQYSLPPPGTARALPSPASLVLFDGDVLAVWIRGHTLGFGGFSDERAAADAALVAYAALSCWVDRRRYTPPPLPATLRPTVCADARCGDRWVLADRLPVARLVDSRSVRVDDDCEALPPPTPPQRSAEFEGHEASSRACAASDTSGPHYGFEIEVPLPVDELGVRGAAHAVYRALCRSGLPWRLWDAGRRARRVNVAAEDADVPTEPAARRRRAGPRVRGPARTAPARDERQRGPARWPDDPSTDARDRPPGPHWTAPPTPGDG